MSFKAGESVGGYELLEQVSTSGVGSTFKARSTHEGRLLALRVLPPELTQSPEGSVRFEREVKILSRLSHSNIVEFHGASTLGGRRVITTEWPEGVSLEKRLQQESIPLGDALDYTCQILDALDYAHGVGVVHRCIAPINVIVNAQGRARLTGFGFAKTSDDTQLTLQGFVVGEAYYVAPEQIRGEPHIDGRADVYSTGALLYHLITGRPPFEAKSIFDVMQAHIGHPPTPPTNVSPDVPGEVSRAVLRAIAKEPSERFQTAGEFRQRLIRLREVLGLEAA